MALSKLASTGTYLNMKEFFTQGEPFTLTRGRYDYMMNIRDEINAGIDSNMSPLYFIAGSFFPRLLSERWKENVMLGDIDIYFETTERYETATTNFMGNPEFELHESNDMQITFKKISSGILYSIIQFEYTPEMVYSIYDIVNAMVCWYPNSGFVLTVPAAIDAIKNRKLVMNHANNDHFMSKRIDKYKKYGYELSADPTQHFYDMVERKIKLLDGENEYNEYWEKQKKLLTVMANNGYGE